MNFDTLKKIDSPIYIVLFISLIGFVLRLNYLDNGPLWNDELATLFYATYGNLDEIRLKLFYSNEPFTHIWFWWKKLNYFLLENFFSIEIQTRFSSFIFGTLSVPMSYKLSRNFTNSYNSYFVCLATALLTTFVFYSTEGRMYSAMLFFGMFLVDYSFERKLSYLKKILYILLASFFIQIHFFALFFFLTIVLFQILNKQKEQIFLSMASLITYITTIPFLFKMFQFSKNNSWIPDPTFKSILGDYFYFSFLSIPGFLEETYTFLFLGFFVFIFFLKLKRKDKIWDIYFGFTLLVLVYIKSLFSQAAFLPRYLIMCIPFLYIMIFSATYFKKSKFDYIFKIITFILLMSSTIFMVPKSIHQRSSLSSFKKEIDKTYIANDSTVIVVCEYHNGMEYLVNQFKDYKNVTFKCNADEVLSSNFLDVYLIGYDYPLGKKLSQSLLNAGYIQKSKFQKKVTIEDTWLERYVRN